MTITHTPTSPLLTGATGFAGGHMLAKLLREEQRPVFCLVRRTALGMFARIEANLKKYDLWEDRFRQWIRPVSADLAHPTLGMSDEAFTALSQRVDTIYHLGGDTHWVKDYAALRDVNVGSTYALVRLASMRPGTEVAFLSSLGVYPDLTAENTEDTPLDVTTSLLNGYAESKRAAELVLPVLRASGNASTTFRTASLSGSVATGIGHANRTIEMFIASCIAMGKAPDADLFFWDLLPVDFVVDMIWTTMQSGARNEVLNIVLPDRRGRQRALQAYLEDSRGVELVSYAEWRREMLANPALPLYPLRAFFPAEGPIANGCRSDRFAQLASELDVELPSVNPAALDRCVSFIESLPIRRSHVAVRTRPSQRREVVDIAA